MDQALILRIKTDQGEAIKDPLTYLSQSEIIKKYTELSDLKPLGKIFALIVYQKFHMPSCCRLLKI